MKTSEASCSCGGSDILIRVRRRAIGRGIYIERYCNPRWIASTISEFHAEFVVFNVRRHNLVGARNSICLTIEKFCRCLHPVCFKRNCMVVFLAALLSLQYDASKIMMTA